MMIIALAEFKVSRAATDEKIDEDKDILEKPFLYKASEQEMASQITFEKAKTKLVHMYGNKDSKIRYLG